MNNDLISREALKKEFCVKFYTTPYYKHILDVIDNAPTVCGNSPKWCESCVSKGKCASTRPQNDYLFKVRTDGDIVDLEGRVIGHTVEAFTEEDMKRTIKENFDIGYEMAKAKFERPNESAN